MILFNIILGVGILKNQIGKQTYFIGGGCVRDGSGNPTLFGVDCNVQPDPWGHAPIIILIYANTY
jgi:hypothetical protein